MMRVTILAALCAVLAACANETGANSEDAATPGWQALNECQARAAVGLNPAAGGFAGTSASTYDADVAQCMRKHRNIEGQ